LIPKLGPKLKLSRSRNQDQKLASVAAAPAATYASGTYQQPENIRRKNIAPASITGTGKAGRITKEDAVMQCFYGTQLVVLVEQSIQIIDVAS
jgi:hypothetical protein